MEQLRLRSEMIHTCEFQQIDLGEFAVPLRPDPERYAQDLKKFCRRFAKKTTAEDVAAEDMVTICCQSENPKFRKDRITVRIGMGLYSRELEQAMVGMQRAQPRTVQVGQSTVTVTVLEIEREIVPELTDELAASAGIPGVKTAEDARTYCRFLQYDDLLEDAAYDAANHFASQLLKRSEFRLDAGERQTAKEIIKGSVDLRALQEASLNAAGEMNAESFLEMLTENTLKTASYGQNMTVLTQADYDAYVKRRAVALECTEEEFSAQEPPVVYMINYYSDYFMDRTEQYAMQMLKELGEAAGKQAQEEGNEDDCLCGLCYL